MWVKCKTCNGSGAVEANSSVGPCDAQCSDCDGHGKVCSCGNKLTRVRSQVPIFDSTHPDIPKHARWHHMTCDAGHNDLKSVLQRSGNWGPYLGLYKDLWYSKDNLYHHVLIKEDVRHIVEFAHRVQTIREWLSDPLFISYAIAHHTYIIVNRDTGQFRQSGNRWGNTPAYFKTPDVATLATDNTNYKVLKLPFDFSKVEVVHERQSNECSD